MPFAIRGIFGSVLYFIFLSFTNLIILIYFISLIYPLIIYYLKFKFISIIVIKKLFSYILSSSLLD